MDKDWDDHFPNGVFAVPRDPNAPRLKVRKLVDWCRANGIPLSEINRLPQEVMGQFLVYPKRNGEQEEKQKE